jgi:hypothetical protein
MIQDSPLISKHQRDKRLCAAKVLVLLLSRVTTYKHFQELLVLVVLVRIFIHVGQARCDLCGLDALFGLKILRMRLLLDRRL